MMALPGRLLVIVLFSVADLLLVHGRQRVIVLRPITIMVADLLVALILTARSRN